MYSGNTPPPFPSAAILAIDQDQTQVVTSVVEQAIGGPIGGNPITADIHGQQNSLNQFQSGTFSRGIDYVDWYSGGGQPPSLGAIRPVVISQPSGSNEIYSDGLPPSLNDLGRREPSQTGASTGREVADAHEMAGMSLTRNNFRRLYEDSYSKGIDGK
ncbi:unnamed protein product [Lactuca virosa]|uniref:Uncharacterized protein n=1 Tax=Lactuca virosa TaxID=75947 RepID=A0AAU9N3R6_9ASTR|nr:unnamed protein product [Lactuca virosa]